MHPLAAEFARVADYVALMQIRMGDRLQPQLDLPDELAALTVPPLLLQPLVENAIKHGLEPHVRGGRLIVSAAREGNRLLLRVRDTGVGPSTVPHPASGDTAGFGLQQIRDRLATLYGGAAGVALEAADDGAGGALATVHLPIESP
jgi:LytS/YehU family sensor histidine kinase